MITINQKHIGLFLIVLSVLLLVVISFVKVEFDKRDAYLCEVSHTTPGLDINQCPAHTGNSSWYITAGYALSIFILAIGLYFTFIPLGKGTAPAKKVDVSKLSEEERSLYDLLKQHDGTMYQTDLIKESGYSKVKMTRILDKMSGKGVIDRSRRGMTNVVFLK